MVTAGRRKPLVTVQGTRLMWNSFQMPSLSMDVSRAPGQGVSPALGPELSLWPCVHSASPLTGGPWFRPRRPGPVQAAWL